MSSTVENREIFRRNQSYALALVSLPRCTVERSSNESLRVFLSRQSISKIVFLDRLINRYVVMIFELGFSKLFFFFIIIRFILTKCFTMKENDALTIRILESVIYALSKILFYLLFIKFSAKFCLLERIDELKKRRLFVTTCQRICLFLIIRIMEMRIK